uniref:Uncharacterized protein n=1 Tax=Corethron hystrix TaxID=216773 RepID=A0A7S1BNA7_9STRA|mmetsp:Transcript_33059/g.76190  ORF Transcript_33059/g.76190 Transcript_33059/m.76190 type:complete len:225 (+) Transcript_33059:281-955(+)
MSFQAIDLSLVGSRENDPSATSPHPPPFADHGGISTIPAEAPSASKRARYNLKPRKDKHFCSCLGGVVPFGEPLKYKAYPDDADDDMCHANREGDPLSKINNCSSTSLESSASLGSSTSLYSLPSNQQNRAKRVRKRTSFSEIVAVMPIPMKEEYSPHVRTRLWASPSEIVQNVARNLVEYSAEGFNWRNVTEDDAMFVCNATGELIHPIHIMNVFGKLDNDAP